VWSAGCVIAEMVMNRPIFEGENSTDQLLRIIRVVGTPSSEEMGRMGVTEGKWELPKVKAVSLGRYLGKFNNVV
jgi:serine/threonine protein kinase